MVGHAPDKELDFSEIQRMEARVKGLAAIGLGREQNRRKRKKNRKEGEL